MHSVFVVLGDPPTATEQEASPVTSKILLHFVTDDVPEIAQYYLRNSAQPFPFLIKKYIGVLRPG